MTLPQEEPHPGQDAPDPTEMPKDTTSSDAVWTFRGYRLRASEFTTAMVHFFRAEIQRANVWRQRLDTTTNWAVITTAAVISIAFSPNGTHVAILLNILLVTIFMLIEARRYRYYELWSYRVRLMETDFFAAMLVPPFHPSADWAETLSENLLHPQFPISILEAIGRRLRRNYLYIYGIILIAWLAILWLIPELAPSWEVFFSRAAIGPLPGQLVFLVVLGFMILLVILSAVTIWMQEATGEVLPRFGAQPEVLGSHLKGKREAKTHAWFRPSRRRPQLLTLIVTDQATAIADQILKDMRRGVTSIPGTGMYSGQSHSIMLCALTVTEVHQLKALVAELDPKAMVMVIPAQEVLGRGFLPLQDEE